MIITFPEITDHILQLSVLVAAIVGIFKPFGVPPKYNNLIALAVAAVFVLVPEFIRVKIIVICAIALLASGTYHYTKKRGSENVNDK